MKLRTLVLLTPITALITAIVTAVITPRRHPQSIHARRNQRGWDG